MYINLDNATCIARWLLIEMFLEYDYFKLTVEDLNKSTDKELQELYEKMIEEEMRRAV